MFIQTPLVRALQAEAVERDLANRQVPPDPDWTSTVRSNRVVCSGCYRPLTEVDSVGHGRGCYFGQVAR